MRILWAALLLACLADAAAPKPHIMFILIDDLGWSNVGWHREVPTPEVSTPNLDALVKDGIELDRHYAFKLCSPSRSAIQSGRNPIHVNVFNIEPTHYNKDDPVAGYAGIPRNMTGLGQVMKNGGYSTHFAGKWDAGMATPQHSPHGRGYDTSLHYFHHMNDYWSDRTMGGCLIEFIDLWATDKPAHGMENPKTCNQTNQGGCVYEDDLFHQEVLRVINSHNASEPLFFFWAPHIAHIPLELKQEALTPFDFIDQKDRRLYNAMVHYLDGLVANVTATLKANGLWDDLLLVVSSDNGGPIYFNGTSGGNNYPLRGGKMSNWDGGIRVPAFVSGGFVPENLRGTKTDGLIALWDWYATFAYLAGVDPTDHAAALAKLPPIDSINVWPFIVGEVPHSPRTELPLGTTSQYHDTLCMFGNTSVNGVIEYVNGTLYKYLCGSIPMNGWTGPFFPNTSTDWEAELTWGDCGTVGTNPPSCCMFDLIADPTEHSNITAQHLDMAPYFESRIKYWLNNTFSPDRGLVDLMACVDAEIRYLGFWGPFVDVGPPIVR